jgi:hypothetical protein
MKFQPKDHALKTGTLIKIRVPEIEEAQKLAYLKRSYIKNISTIPVIGLISNRYS